MKVIGIVGPAGSGKSTVARHLAGQPGTVCLDCDALAWATYHPEGPAYFALVVRFGEGILACDGTVDRTELARIAWADHHAKQELERIVHPEVMVAIGQAIEEHAAKGTKWLLVEGALLLSSSYVDRSLFDAFVWLDVPEGERRARLLRSGLGSKVLEQRLAAQRDLLPPSDPRVHVVDGSGSPERVARRVRSLLDRLGSA